MKKRYGPSSANKPFGSAFSPRRTSLTGPRLRKADSSREELVGVCAAGNWLERFSCRPVRATSSRDEALEGIDGDRQNATCTFCGCVCDDIELHAEGDKIVKAKNACSLGDAHFRYHTAERHYPDALIDGKPATVDDAVEVAADILYNANMPLVYGLSNVTCEARRAPSRWPK